MATVPAVWAAICANRYGKRWMFCSAVAELRPSFREKTFASPTRQPGSWSNATRRFAVTAISDAAIVALPLWCCEYAPKMRSRPRKKASPQAGLPYESVHSARRLLFRRSDCVFDRLGDVELHHGLGRDLEGFAGLGIAADARLAGGLFQPAKSGKNEDAVFLGLLHGDLRESAQEHSGALVAGFHLFRQKPHQGGFGQACCHRVFLLEDEARKTPRSRTY